MRALLFSLMLLLAACDQSPAPSTQDSPAPVTARPVAMSEQEKALRAAVSEASNQRLRRLNATANGFADAITGLLDDPGDARLATAQQAWEHFYAGFNQAAVILECRAQSSEHGQARLARSDPFPILPGYIDSLARWPGSGIVNDTNVSLTREALLEQQGATSDAEASLGFQVIQFLLFGEPEKTRAVADLALPGAAPADTAEMAETEETEETEDEAGTPAEPEPASADEPATDAATALAAPDADGGEHGAADYAPLPPENQIERRRAYLATATELLVEDILLLAHNNSALPQSVQDCPVSALRRVTARLLLLANMDAEQSVAGDYMAANAQQIARDNLHQALTGWLEKDGALAAWAYSQDETIRPTLDPLLDSPPDANDVQALQQLHALLARLEQ